MLQNGHKTPLVGDGEFLALQIMFFFISRWQSGGKSLTLDVVMKILCEIKDTGDWVKALSHIPKRKGKLRAQYTEEYKQVMKGLRGKNQ